MLKKDDKTVFKGLIGYYNTKREGNLYTIIIKAVSATSLLDSQIKSQSFQDVNMTYSNVINESIKDINGASFLFNLEDKTIDEPIIRYNETAWEFINRLVSHFSSVLVCDIIENKPRFYFGFNKKNTINIDDSLFYESSKDLLSLNLSVDKLMDTDVFYHEIKSREVYELQDTVNFKNKTLFISSIKGEFIKSELIFTYKLSRLKGIRQNKIYNENIKGASLEGKVLDTKEELVKLHLNIDDKQDKATAYWFKVAQLTNNVFYIMYEKDTFARLYFPSNKEVEAEVKNSVRKNGSTCPLTKKPENRYLTTKDKNQMSLKPSSVEFKSNEGLKLSTLVEDSFGAKLVSHKNINLNSKGSISFHAKNMVNIKAKTDVLFYRDNKLNPQSFTMENEFHYLGNNVLLEGADRSSYSMLDDDPLLVTPIKEGFFDGFLDGLGKFALGVAAGLAGVACVAAVVGTGGLALAAAGVVTMGTVGSAVMGAFVVGGISVVVSEGINRGRGVELNQEESFKMGISAAVSGAVMGAFGMANALKINIGAAVIGESATQIMDREFRPMDFGLTIGMEVIFYGIGKGIVKVKAMKAEGRSLIPKNIDVKQALKSGTNKLKVGVSNNIQKIKAFKESISKSLLESKKSISNVFKKETFDRIKNNLSNMIMPQSRWQLAFEGVDNNNSFKFDVQYNNTDDTILNSSIKHNNNVTKKNLPSKTTEYESIAPNKLLGRDYPKILNPREDLYKNIKLRNGIKAKPKPLTKSQRKIANEILDDISAQSRGCIDAKNRLQSRGDHKLTNRMHGGGQNYDGWNSVYITEQGGSPGVMRIFYKEINDGILWQVVQWH